MSHFRFRYACDRACTTLKWQVRRRQVASPWPQPEETKPDAETLDGREQAAAEGDATLATLAETTNDDVPLVSLFGSNARPLSNRHVSRPRSRSRPLARHRDASDARSFLDGFIDTTATRTRPHSRPQNRDTFAECHKYTHARRCIQILCRGDEKRLTSSPQCLCASTVEAIQPRAAFSF